MVKRKSFCPDLLKCKLPFTLGEMKGCFLSETVKRGEITSLALSPGFHFQNSFQVRRGEMLCMISLCLEPSESRGHLEQSPVP